MFIKHCFDNKILLLIYTIIRIVLIMIIDDYYAFQFKIINFIVIPKIFMEKNAVNIKYRIMAKNNCRT